LYRHKHAHFSEPRQEFLDCESDGKPWHSEGIRCTNYNLLNETDGDIPIIHLRRDIEPGTDKAILLAAEDNQSALVSIDFDPERLAEEIAQGVDFSGVFTEEEQKSILDGLVKEPPEEESQEPPIDKAEELQEKWQCELGQIWQIESKSNPGHYHRLICGDCRDIATVEALTQGEKVNGIFTSPPYAMQRAKQYGGIPENEYVEWWGAVQENVWAVLAEDGSFFVNIKPHCEDGQRVLYVFDLVLAMVRRWRWRFVDELCWKRQSIPGIFGDRFKNGFEPVYHFSLTSCKFSPDNVMKVSDLSKYDIYDDVNGKIAMGSNFAKRQSTARGVKSKNFNGALPDNVLSFPTGAMSGSLSGHGATFPLKLPTFFIKA
jgi:DNA modification methylase